MNVEEIRNYCLSLPLATEDFPFDETTLVFRVLGKIFAMIDLEDTQWFVLKCDPELALDLRDRHLEIKGAWHMNKKYWNQVDIFGALPSVQIMRMIDHSYAEVVKKMTAKAKRANPAITAVGQDIHALMP